jgi:hypothetical protein
MESGPVPATNSVYSASGGGQQPSERTGKGHSRIAQRIKRRFARFGPPTPTRAETLADASLDPTEAPHGGIGLRNRRVGPGILCLLNVSRGAGAANTHLLTQLRDANLALIVQERSNLLPAIRAPIIAWFGRGSPRASRPERRPTWSRASCQSSGQPTPELGPRRATDPCPEPEFPRIGSPCPPYEGGVREVLGCGVGSRGFLGVQRGSPGARH